MSEGFAKANSPQRAGESKDDSWEATRPAEVSNETFKRPATVDRYVLLKRLGGGAMGEVFAAYDPKLDRKLALKLLHPRLSDEEALQRLQREAKAMARLAHPNVVTVYDVNTSGSDVFVAMEWVRGGDLGDWLGAEDRGWQEILEVYEQAGQGLAAAHAAGLVHRDFKPENVLIGPSGRAQVTDFGLARSGLDEAHSAALLLHYDGASETPEDLTATGALVGTPAYMAPELFLGELADEASDQYAFCVALWQALYGERPFSGKNLPALMKTVLDGQIKEPPTDSGVPPWLLQALLRGLSRDPEERWPSMATLLEELNRRPERSRRRRLGTLAAVAAAAVGCVTIFLFLAQDDHCRGAEDQIADLWGEPQRQRISSAFEATGVAGAEGIYGQVHQRLDNYAAKWAQSTQDLCKIHRAGESSDRLFDRQTLCLDRAESGLSTLVSIFESPDERVVLSAVNAVRGLPQLDRCSNAAAMLAKLLPSGDADTSAAVERWRGALQRVSSLNRSGRSKEARTRIAEILPQIRDVPYPPLHAEALEREGMLKAEAYELEGAEAALLAAWEIALEFDHHEIAQLAASRLVKLYGAQQTRFEDAEAWIRHAGAMTRKLGHSPTAANRYLRAVGSVAKNRGEYPEALVHFQKAIDEMAKEYPEGAAEVLEGYELVGQVHVRLGNWEQASEAFESSHSALEQLYGSRHPRVAGNLMNLGLTYGNLGRLEEERRVLGEALVMTSAAHGPDHVLAAKILSNLGLSHAKDPSGNSEQAEQHLTEAARILRLNLGTDHMDVAVLLANLGRLQTQIGSPQARTHLEEALAIFTRLGLDEHPMKGYAHRIYGRELLGRGENAAAVQNLQRALALHPPEKSSAMQIAGIETDLARGLFRLGEKDRAESHMRSALTLFKGIGPRAERQIDEAEEWLQAFSESK